MPTHNYTVLPEQAQEDALHANRLLIVEERPFQRVTRNLLGKDSPLKWSPPKQLPSPPPDEGEEVETRDLEDNDEVARRQRFREEVLLDFAALESSIIRIQLIQSSNARERQRYAAEKAKILETAQAVKQNTIELRAQLADAQHVLQLRKGYDELAAKLIDPKKLKPRAETQEDIDKLEKEIEDLQHESEDYEGVWAGRKEAFERMVSEAEAMIRVVKGIKDEPEQEGDKDEAMEDAEDVEPSVKDGRSRMGTPAREAGGRTPMAGGILRGGSATPRPRAFPADGDDGIRTGSQLGTPLLRAQEDVEMTEGDGTAASMLMASDADVDSLEPQAKTTSGMEATASQVATPAESADLNEDSIDVEPNA